MRESSGSLNIDKLKMILNHALKGEPLTEDVFSDDFLQILNGREIAHAEFESGLLTLRETYPHISYKILSVASSDNSVHSHHLVTTTDKEEVVNHFEVFARYDFNGGKAVRCYESLRELAAHDPMCDLI
ncbi:TPA: hypothetical protein JG922_000479 [Enterobacter hormaechei subsp. steigerwaltii]|nr:hypothetical protein [Enterobacter hormaechei subsp. steigerwaltii]